MSLIMSPTKKTDKKQAKPKRFEKLSHEERMKMSYKDIQTHLVYAIKHVHNEKKPKRGKK